MRSANGAHWRVTFNADGSIASAQQVEDSAGGERWVIVWAKTEDQARRKAFRVFCQRYASEREQALRAEGRCQCGRVLDARVTVGPLAGQCDRRCSFCLQRHAHGRRRQRERERDDDGLRPEPSVTHDGTRLAILTEVQRAWIVAHNVGQFSSWLKDQIAALVRTNARVDAIIKRAS